MNGLREIKAALDTLGVRPKKSRGQNFLFEKGAIQKILTFAAVRPDEDLLEVGPGLGAITERVSAEGHSFRAVDVEPKFIEYLQGALPAIPAENFLCRDIRETTLADLGFSPARPATVVSNVPYSLSSEFILWLVTQSASVARASLLLQREFAERVAAAPGGKDYGSLSVWCALVADVRLGPKISGNCFFPAADVESRLVELRMLEEPRFDVGDRDHFERALRASFAKRRKTILNSLHSSEHFGEKAEVERRLQIAGIDPGRRGETLTLAEFVALSAALR